jgi:hypothetical protein
MVRLTCKNDKCRNIWNETKKQRGAENVYCPKCGRFHHKHSLPVKPPTPEVIKEPKKRHRTPLTMINPPEEFEIIQKSMDGRALRTQKAYRTKKVKKDGKD